jgi:hypothetical protein
MAMAVLDEHGSRSAIRAAEALMLIRMLRDLVGWAAVQKYIDSLPAALRAHGLVMEQEYLALAKSAAPGAAARAVGKLQAMITRSGETSERLGLLGGRYKQLIAAAGDDAERARYLDLAIDAYARGMLADLNDYYPASNLPRLYRRRGRPEDAALAAEAEAVTMAACRRALARRTTDEWVRPTLLGLAFDRGDVVESRRLLAEVRAEGPAAWQLSTTIDDLRGYTANADDDVRRGLAEVLAQLESLLPTRAAAR